MSTLSLAQRSVVYFVYWENRTEAETAELLDVSVGTVRRQSIAAAEGIPVEDLLDFNGFTIAELEAAGETIASPLEIGRAISLSIPQPTLDTVPTTTG